jgi:hypothetical protein
VTSDNSHIAAAIALLEFYRVKLAELDAERQKLKAAISAVEATIPGRFSGGQVELRPPPRVDEPLRPPPTITVGYTTVDVSNLGPTKAIQTYLRSRKVPATASEISDFLENANLRTKAENIRNLVNSTLSQSDSFVYDERTRRWGLAEWQEGGGANGPA